VVQEESSDGAGAAEEGVKGEGDVDMQVTFDSGLETLGERLASKKGSKAAETLWQAYEKRRRCAPIQQAPPHHYSLCCGLLWLVRPDMGSVRRAGGSALCLSFAQLSGSLGTAAQR
jgi:hypothetical protein